MAPPAGSLSGSGGKNEGPWPPDPSLTEGSVAVGGAIFLTGVVA